jgi:hypothetical protein
MSCGRVPLRIWRVTSPWRRPCARDTNTIPPTTPDPMYDSDTP